jgi:hypothetical protein
MIVRTHNVFLGCLASLADRLLDYAEPEGTDGFIGHSLFVRHVVCVDFQRKAFVVRRQ